MNPFNVSRFGTININLEHLNSLPVGMDPVEFVNSVVGTILEKMGGANVALAVNSPFHLPNMKELYIHDSRNLEAALGVDPSALGSTLKAEGIAEVNVNDVFNGFTQAGGANPADFSEAVGTVCSHEIGHAYLPYGHSVDGSSLMGDGSEISGMLGNGGAALGFTDLQVQMMNFGIAAHEDPALLDSWQNETLADMELDLGQAAAGVDAAGLASMDGMDGLEALDPGVWGNFDPSVMGSIGGLGDLSGYGDLAGAFDLSGLDAVGADGIAEMVCGIDPDAVGEVASGLADGGGDLLDGLGEILSGLFG